MSLFSKPYYSEDYQRSLAEYGPGPKALLWWDYRSMALRFRALVKNLPLDSRDVLDAGCGMGDLLPFLYAKSTSFNYLGVDINRGFIKIAKQRYEGHNFKVADPFSKKLGKFDVILSSGVMNGNYEGWLDKRKQMIEALYTQTTEVLAFNMAGGLQPIANDQLIAYADANEVYKYCKTLCKKVVLQTDYLQRDFTIVMFKR